MKRALFIGRFQPFHNGHFETMKNLLKKYTEVIVVVGSSDEAFTRENPFTAGERIEMIRTCYTKKDLAKLIIIPIPDINDNTIWVDHVLSYVPTAQDIFSNNQLVKMLFSRHGILVKSTSLHKREVLEGTKIREQMMSANGEWKKQVPKKVVEYLEDIDAERRMKKIVMMRH